ncbi:MAG: MoaD/ThiS family protein [Euryarchaeota archaeon]|nr:MoaD/ThiS family protein [Euryarchaeota archaeon]
MMIKITMIPSNVKKDIDMKTGSIVSDLLEKLHLKPDTIIVLRNSIPVPVDDVITDMDELKIVQVASGG